jgi:hypothetical protein
MPRPLSITLLALLLIVSGAVGLVYHFSELDPHHLLQNDALWVELIRILAIVAGIFLLRGRNWARWLAMLWIGFHVVISFWHPWPQLIMHAAVFVVFAFFLFRPAASRYFGSSDRATA